MPVPKVCATVAAAMAVFYGAPAYASLSTEVYHLNLCAAACSVTNQVGTPSASAIGALNNGAFAQYFAYAAAQPIDASYSWTVDGGTQSGYAYGRVTSSTLD